MSQPHGRIDTQDYDMVFALERGIDALSPRLAGLLWHAPDASPETALLSVSQLTTRLAGVCGIHLHIVDFGREPYGVTSQGLYVPRSD